MREGEERGWGGGGEETEGGAWGLVNDKQNRHTRDEKEWGEKTECGFKRNSKCEMQERVTHIVLTK